MNALFLTKYSTRGASSRYRALQYFPYLRSQGWSITCQPFLSDAYLERFYNRGRRSAREGIDALLRRTKYICSGRLRDFDLVYIEAEALPRVPFLLESLMLRSARRIVVDYDDAIFIRYQGNPAMRNKIAAVMGAAAEVIVGNEFLRAYACRHSSHVQVIPTVIDVAKYQPQECYERSEPPRIVVGWVGTPDTARHLASFAGVLQRLARRYPIWMRCVGTQPDFHIPGVDVENLPWSEETEAELIGTFDIGVMPLID
jgi:glycosyltransferase involved in cell wall biosynthesis